MNKLVVFGSVNIDEVYSVPHIVKPGETITALSREELAGGKGANCSVASARAGASTHLVSNLGPDGKWILDLVNRSGANVESSVVSQDKQTGRAIIQVGADGENSIFLFPGANTSHILTTVEEKLNALGLGSGDYLISANETNLVPEVLEFSKTELGVVVIYNPAPMPTTNIHSLFESLRFVDILVVNETELLSLSKLTLESTQKISISHEDMSHALKSCDYDSLVKYIGICYAIKLVVVTKGSSGVTAQLTLNGVENIPRIFVNASPVKQDFVVDTTAAGDTWIGYFAASLAESDVHNLFSRDSPPSIEELQEYIEIFSASMKRANYASGIVVTKKGAIPSIPEKSSVDSFIHSGIIHHQ
ncbi:Ribokinase [Smittium mucronatum]|uniref:Ribokinase n=1 Tax=Smittium mucronatum TaxID=133383 RepID=A0A1R0GQ37_9FUNG|nr:Ribokinase [Smittium mucronatum]